MDTFEYLYLKINKLSLLPGCILTMAILVIRPLAGASTDTLQTAAHADTLRMTSSKATLQTTDPMKNARVSSLQWALAYDAGIWFGNRYIRQQDWAVIGIQSLKNNIEHGWVMDEDEFDVNQFGHPYQGALVFSAARAQGLDFWQASPYPIISSYIWEMAMENEYPSINDMITTPLSGITFGEISHRISLLLYDGSGNRVQMLGASVLNPARIPQIWRMKSTQIKPKLKRIPAPFTAGIAMGAGHINESFNGTAAPDNGFMRFFMKYGDILKSDKNQKPFEHFEILLVLNFRNDEIVAEIYSSGLLYQIYQKTVNQQAVFVGLYKNYDYLNQDEYKFSSSEIGIGLFYRLQLDKLLINGEIEPSYIILGSSGDTHDADPDLRDYVYGNGRSLKGQFTANYGQWMKLYLRIANYQLKNFDSDDDLLFEETELIKFGLQLILQQPVSVGFEQSEIFHHSDNIDNLDTENSASVSRIYLIYNF